MLINRFLTTLLCLAACLPLSGRAADFGEVKFLKGEAVNGIRPIKLGDKVQIDDVITTGPKSFMRILLAEGAAMSIGPGSTIRITKLKASEPTSIDLLKGMLLSKVKRSSAESAIKFKVRTRSAAMGVRGTTFFAKEEEDGRTFLCVCEGTVETRWPKGTKIISSKHHDAPAKISALESKMAAAEMGHDHTDEEAAELEKLIR
jgi:hypothetical protein